MQDSLGHHYDPFSHFPLIIGNDSILDDGTMHHHNGSNIQPVTNGNWKLLICLVSLSALFLSCSVVIYILLGNRQNLHGWIQFSYLLSFDCFNFVLIPALVPGLTEGVQVNLTCFFLSVANQYFFMVSKTWLVIIGVDILKAVWKMEYFLEKRNKVRGKTLCIYTLIAWCLPSGIVAYGIALNSVYKDWLEEMKDGNGSNVDTLWVPVPDYGRRHCRIPTWTIWEVFVFSNCVIHIVLFLCIIGVILKHRFMVVKTLGPMGQGHVQRFYEGIVLVVKLFIIVGLSWGYIALQDLLNAGNINTNQGLGWQIFRCIFFLQGVFISLIYIANGTKGTQLMEKYPGLNAFVDNCKRTIGRLWCCLRRHSNERPTDNHSTTTKSLSVSSSSSSSTSI